MMARELAIIWAHKDELIDGVCTTAVFSALAGACVLATGAFVAAALMARMRAVAALARGFVDLMRCTPFLLFVYLIYYGLPSLGIRLDNRSAAFIALLVYHTAYIAEILRTGWAGRPRDEIDAGHAFGFHGFRLVRRLILPPVFFATSPVLGNQFIQIIKDSSFLTIIAVPELTFAANSIQSNYYIPFAAFIAAVLLYWLLCSAIELAVATLRRMSEQFQ
ncbi:MAG: polar amino acid transport system permease protein [Paraburkholderia sp.]|jgi:polar amino acid transport system permease protein|nr:polar amino acid transport system permease protein [Paraburkholderia sp.]MEA3121695.1 polar amino acid transport system permease protein [Paraburkholderia sp.]